MDLKSIGEIRNGFESLYPHMPTPQMNQAMSRFREAITYHEMLHLMTIRDEFKVLTHVITPLLERMRNSLIELGMKEYVQSNQEQSSGDSITRS